MRVITERISDLRGPVGAWKNECMRDCISSPLFTALLEAGELCVCDLSWVCERAENLVSHHVRALRSAGIVSSRRDGKMVMYTLTEHGAHLLAAVLAPRTTATA